MKKSNYKSFADRIRKARSNEEFENLEKSWHRLVDAGIFTENEAIRLTQLLMHTHCEWRIENGLD